MRPFSHARLTILAAISMALLLAIDLHVALGDDNDELPNIVWITSEDNGAHWLGCYGNEQAHTPRLDDFARKSVVFNCAYSNAPVCAVARSTLLHGVYAVSSGTQHMRSRHPIPDRFRPYVSYLRELGYYCTNNQKTDYNREGNDHSIWDVCNRKAHYKNRREGQPFFAIFNLTVSHESCLFPANVAKNRERGLIPQQTRLAADQIRVPPYLPDLPEVRRDIAVYHDTITALDTQVGKILDELAASGLADDTLVFYYSDHGGATPRGKRYLKDTGVKVPMIVHVPDKWQHLSPFQSGQSTDELVAFVDLAPTLLSLCGQQKPEQMQGRAFLGSERVEPTDDAIVFLYADRFDELYGMRRGITDGRYKYIRRFTPHLPAAPYSEYSFGQPAWEAWRQAWRSGKLSPGFAALWEAPQPVEELYDLTTDPWETNNLAGDPAHASRLAVLSERLMQTMTEVRDTGILPEPMFQSLAVDGTIADYVRGKEFDFDRILAMSDAATSRDMQGISLPAIVLMLADEDPVVRFWGALGCVINGDQLQHAAEVVRPLLEDEHATIRMTAAQALYAMGKQQEGISALLGELDKLSSAEEVLWCSNLVSLLGCEQQVSEEWIEKNRSPAADEYTRRFAERLRKKRQAAD